MLCTFSMSIIFMHISVVLRAFQYTGKPFVESVQATIL